MRIIMMRMHSANTAHGIQLPIHDQLVGSPCTVYPLIQARAKGFKHTASTVASHPMGYPIPRAELLSHYMYPQISLFI